MSLYALQKLLYHLNRDPRVKARFREDLDGLLGEYELTTEERQAIAGHDIGKLYVLGVNGQLLMHLYSQIGHPLAHGGDVLGPGLADLGGEVHQQLPVDPQDVELADVVAGDRLALLGG